MRSVVDALPLPVVFYHAPDYLFADDAGKFIRVNESSAKRFIRQCGYVDRMLEGRALSDVEKCLLDIQKSQNVAYSGRLAGHAAALYTINGNRILVTESPRFIVAQAGEFPVLRGVLEGMFNDDEFEQLPYVYGWLKKALEGYQHQLPMPGQILAMAGARGSGKSLFQSILTQLFGGRTAKPYLFLAGKTTFNADLFQGEHLCIEDEAEFTDIRSRRHFGASLKQLAVNQVHQCHGKNKDAVGLTPLWRTSISLNNDPERLMVLPPMDEDIADKVMLLKVHQSPFPMPTDTPQQRQVFWTTLLAELPAFVHYLQSWKLPAQLHSNRFGVIHFHHPELLAALDEHAPEHALLELIDTEVFRTMFDGKPAEFTAQALHRRLTRDNSQVRREAEKLLTYSSACGAYLGRLALDQPNRVKKRKLHGQHRWTIMPPPPSGHQATQMGEEGETYTDSMKEKKDISSSRAVAVAHLTGSIGGLSVPLLTQAGGSNGQKPVGPPKGCSVEEAIAFLQTTTETRNTQINEPSGISATTSSNTKNAPKNKR